MIGSSLSDHSLNYNCNEISLYFHIPFCTKKCDYCHFYVLPNNISLHQMLLEGFDLEIALRKPSLVGKKLVSIYFGGGTPSLIGAEAIAHILSEVRQIIPFVNSEIEITLEANPEILTFDLMTAYRLVGINRVSIGVQSFDDQLLHKLGRTHHAKTAITAVEVTKSAGIDNISIDLMYDIPGQTLNAWENTLIKACQLPIQHLSLYNLTIEPNTVFFKYKDSLIKQLPDAESSTLMYGQAVEILESHGLMQYEISAFAKNDQYSRHNTGYWLARPFFGFGPSAFSYWEGRRFRMTAHLHKYLKKLQAGEFPIDFTEELPIQAHLRELFVIALRLKKGVDLEKFERQHGKLEINFYEVLGELIFKGFILKEASVFTLSNQGILFYDSVAVELI